MDELTALAEVLFNGGETWTGSAISLLNDMNTLWSFEMMGINLTDANLVMQSEFLEAIRTIENGIRFGFWEEDAIEKIMAGAEYFDQYPGYGDPSDKLGAILADIKADLQ